MKNEFYFPSRDGNTEIHTVEWKPEGEVKAVLQISHGMVEYVNRYDEFAEYLCSRGIYVVGNDHLGHGKSIQSKADHGFFHEKYGNVYVLGDMHTLRQRTMEKYADVPYFMFGHSMGSTFLRQYIQMYGNGLSGVILSGVVSEQPAAKLLAAKKLCKAIATCKGWRYRSKLVNDLAFGSYNKKFKEAITKVDWITSDPDKLQEYMSDALCSFMFTVNAYYHMFEVMQAIQKKEGILMIPKNLPILMAAGSDDPVGDFGRGVKRVYERYQDLGIRDIMLKLYDRGRHEILNEKDRQRVYRDIHEWIKSKIQ